MDRSHCRGPAAIDGKDKTQIGGSREAFEQTRWTDILDARTMDAERRRRAVGKVMARYWKPVYAYLRR
ncbi:MAG: hypothetical protein WBF17_04970, partial [Phycisphaerae bacterium]